MSEDTDEFANKLKEMIESAESYETCMGFSVSEEGQSVDLILDTARNYYSDWIKGEGADICLYRDQETKKVVGCHLPLYNKKLVVHYAGPMRINEGFINGRVRKAERP